MTPVIATLKIVARVTFGLIGLAASALGAWAIVLALMEPNEVNCGVTPYNIAFGAEAGLFGTLLLAFTWRASRRTRLLCLGGFAASLTLLLLWKWLLGPDCPYLSR